MLPAPAQQVIGAAAGSAGQPGLLAADDGSRLSDAELLARYSTDKVRLCPITPESIESLTQPKHDSFGSKAFCCCMTDSWSETRSRVLAAYSKCPPEKMRLGALAVQVQAGDGPQKVVGFLQMAFSGMPGDLEMPFECMKHTCGEDEAYIEQLGITREARGKGTGSALLGWAHTMARQAGKTRVQLDVVNSNVNAMRLYERLGYRKVVVEASCCDRCIERGVVMLILSESGLTRMEKHLAPSGAVGPEPAPPLAC